MEAKSDTEKAAKKAADAAENTTEQAVAMVSEQLAEFTDTLTQTFEKAQQQFSATVAKLREEAANVDFEGARTRAKSWIDENQTLSVALAVGAGLLVGRALGSAFTPEPPTLKKRALKQAQRVQHYATNLGSDLAERAALAGGALAAGSTAAAAAAAHRAREMGGTVADQAAHVGGRVVDYAEDVMDSVQGSTKSARKQLKKKSRYVRSSAEHGLDFAGSLVDAARTAVAAVVVKKISDWTRKVA